LYCRGYLEIISSALFMLSAENAKGIYTGEGLSVIEHEDPVDLEHVPSGCCTPCRGAIHQLIVFQFKLRMHLPRTRHLSGGHMNLRRPSRKLKESKLQSTLARKACRPARRAEQFRLCPEQQDEGNWDSHGLDREQFILPLPMTLLC
jgi:hypothetical protein